MRISVVENSDNLFYDLNGICDNADSIYWTLVPNEMFAIYNSNPYLPTNRAYTVSLEDTSNWW
jgi:hypothetical protein